MAHVITLTGPSGCGKSTILRECLALASSDFRPLVISKASTRKPRDNDGSEIDCADKIPENCDLVYEQYGVRYGLPSSVLFDALRDGISPLVIINDVRLVEDIRRACGSIVRSVFVFREGPDLRRSMELAAKRGKDAMLEAETRYRKAQAIYRIYIENIHLFDHVVLNSGSMSDLQRQVAAIVAGLRQDEHWPLV